MPTYKEIVEQEHSRQKMDEIHLYAEGTFLRAYEQSAWLCVRCIHEFKVTKRQMKAIDTPVCFVGFPQSSTEKWLSKFQVQTVDDKHTVVHLPEDSLPSTEVDQLKEMFQIWKDNIEISLPTKTLPKVSSEVSEHDGGTLSGKSRLTDIMRAVLSFPLENKTPIDSMLFLADIKKRMADII